MNESADRRSQRAARQLIESWQRAGVTHLKRMAPVPQPPVEEAPAIQLAAPVVSQPPEPSPVQRETQPVLEAGSPLPSAPAEIAPRDVVNETETPRKEMSVARTAKSKLTKAERQAELEIVAAKVAKCKKCPELASTRTQTVFGVGNPKAKIMFIGEAPGADEDKQGEPFVGRAGKLMDKIIEACQIKRSDIYIANILRCRPPGNRNPTNEEADNCRGFLDAQIEIVDPDYIVCWGSVAAKNLLHSELPIGKMRGQFYEYGRARVVCTYHPSYLLRNPSAKKNVWDDMIYLFADMGVDLKAQS